MKIQTEFQDFAVDNHLLSSVERKAQGLHNFLKHIQKVKIVFKKDGTSRVKKRVAEVTIHIPNAIMYVKEHSKCLETALDKAIISAKLQLMTFKRKRMSLGYMS
jgi:ribosomal subunit interface protein